MDIWKMLGIGPTDDIRAIKAAYARQAGRYHPEEYPQQFQILQKAYKAAVRYAKSGVTKAETTVRSEASPEAGTRGEGKQENREEAKTGPAPEIVPEPELHKEPEPEPFDYRGIDAFARQEELLGQIRMVAWNPCLMNNLIAWKVFLRQPPLRILFTEHAFRLRFVRLVCNISGWKRQTILYFAEYLRGFHNAENLLQSGMWETDLPAFRRLMRRFPPRKTMREEYLTEAGRALSEQIREVFARQGRELYGDNEKDVIDYIRVWLTYGECYGQRIRERFGCSYQEAVSRIYNMERRRSSWRLKKETKKQIRAVLLVVIPIVLVAVFLHGVHTSDEYRDVYGVLLFLDFLFLFIRLLKCMAWVRSF